MIDQYPDNLTADATHEIRRVSSPFLDSILGHSFPVLNHGFVRVIDYMGDDSAVVQAARVSYGAGTKSVSDDRGLIRYLMRHHHSTPFEMCEIKLHVKLPVFVARQWIRHRTANVNEYSARYSILDREFYVPDAANIAKQSPTNSQGRAEDTDDMRPEEIQEIMRKAANSAFDDYDLMIDDEGYGVARELARINLPLSAYTQWYWKVDLHNLLHFLRLRCDPHAQYEIRVYADVIAKLLSQWVPLAMGAFEDYKLKAVTLSSMEFEALRRWIAMTYPDDPEYGGSGPVDLLEGVSRRERDEFVARFTK